MTNGLTRFGIASTSPVRMERGTARSCRGWSQEATLQLLHNYLDPEVAEYPEEFVV